mmetsp:Transcript_44978/g.79734  ORF Transcript_44978/g.79734 Transcript_44978/m.79734 type:complete len:664 (-) Transcript_44978:209-2200(-)
MEIRKATERIAKELQNRGQNELFRFSSASDTDSEDEDEANTDLKGKYDVTLHSHIPATRWCIDIHGLNYFEEEVKKNLEDGALFPIRECKGFPKSQKFDAPEVGPNIYEVVEHYIKPFTAQQGGMSWALWWNCSRQKEDNWWHEDNGGELFDCDVFATHAWAEGVFEFIGKVKRSWPIDATRIYICFLANPQNEGGIAEILKNPDIDQSPFAQCLTTAKHFLVIPNQSVSIYERLWCVFEAHKAIDKGIDIRIPTLASPWVYFSIVGLGMVIFATFSALGYLVIAPIIGPLMGPMLWIVAAYILNWIGSTFMEKLLTKLLPKPYHPKLQVVVRFFQLAMIGTGAALSMWHLRGMGGQTVDENYVLKCGRDTFFQGEGWACVPLILSFVASSIWQICSALNQDVVNLEGAALQFQSVTNAVCSAEADDKRIRKAISGKEAQIDTAIKTLKRIGRYDKNVKGLLESGLRPDFVRDGFDPFQLIFIVYSWEYWLVTDLSYNLHHYYGQFIPMGSCFVMLIIGYFVGLQFVFAIEVAQWFGLFYVVSSLLVLLLIGHEEPENKYLSLQTLPELIFWFTMMSIVLVYHYSGMRKKHMDRCCPTLAARQISRDDDDDQDLEMSEAFSLGCGEEVSTESSESSNSSSPLLDSSRSTEGEERERCNFGVCR